MSSHQSISRQKYELDLIKRDVCLYLEIMSKLSKQKGAPILFPGLAPYLSLFVVEVHNYLDRNLPNYNNSLSNQINAIITAARMRVKFFDDTHKGVSGTFNLLEWVADFHEEWHIKRHNGILSPVQRYLQDDIGVFFYESHIIGSTHTGVLNLGYAQGDLPNTSESISAHISKLSFSIGEGFGSYISNICSLPEFTTTDTDFGNFTYSVKDEELKYKDDKSDKLLQRIFNKFTSTEVNLSLLLFLTQVNYLQYILTGSVMAEHYTLFKIKYILLYHLVSSLQKLRDDKQSASLLTRRSVTYIDNIILDIPLAELISKRQFRNILVHYGIPPSLDGILSPQIEFYGLVEHFFNGNSYSMILEQVNCQLSRISQILEEWLDWEVKQQELRSW